ncbi:pyridoxamine 5'-phosphate oxidase family protein [Candidatus Gottesmanbacteria bacterium]|nr:pyridoxamine 5'-phosphate oxidase family protein [Candidatus Gottesmanbacteria bacterium]
MDKKKFLFEYMNKRNLAVLATIGPNETPEAAVMEFGQTQELELIFDTLKTTRKYANLKKSPKIAFVIGWEEGDTVQYEGVATELKGAELATYKKIMFAKNPAFAKWENLPSMTYFKVTPKWIRYSTMDQPPWEITFS